MNKFTPTQRVELTERGTLDSFIGVLEQHFDLSAAGYLRQTQELWQVLVAVCARESTNELTCNDLLKAPDSNTVRLYLNQQLKVEKIGALQKACNEVLASQLLAWFTEHPQEIACDLHDEPYYGIYGGEDPDNWVCGGEAWDGTSHFYRCATAYILRPAERMTLAFELVNPKNDRFGILQRLLQRVQALVIASKRLYLDKGFCSIPILRHLQAKVELPVIMAVPVRGKKGGTRALGQSWGSYRTAYTFHSQFQGELTIPVTVVRTFAKRRHCPPKAPWLVYALLHCPDLPVRRVRKLDRRRFGIESSYRMMEKTRARTTSHNAALRFLFMGLALLILNVWVALHWIYLRIHGRGP